MAERRITADFQRGSDREAKRTGINTCWRMNFSPCFGHITIISTAENIPLLVHSVLFGGFPQLSQTEKSGRPSTALPSIRFTPEYHINLLNLLKPIGHVMHQQFNIQQLYVLPTLYLSVLYLSENKQRLVPLTA